MSKKRKPLIFLDELICQINHFKLILRRNVKIEIFGIIFSLNSSQQSAILIVNKTKVNS